MNKNGWDVAKGLQGRESHAQSTHDYATELLCAVGLHQSSCGVHQGRSRAHQSRSGTDLRQVRLGLGTAIPGSAAQDRFSPAAPAFPTSCRN
jgi:hypothetical protein